MLKWGGYLLEGYPELSLQGVAIQFVSHHIGQNVDWSPGQPKAELDSSEHACKRFFLRIGILLASWRHRSTQTYRRVGAGAQAMAMRQHSTMS